MKFERRFKLLILLNILVSMFGFGFANQSLGLLIPAVLLAIAGWWTTEVRSRTSSWAGLPRWFTSIVLVILLLVAGVRAWMAEQLVGGFTEFLAAVIVLKLWEKRAPRDYGQLITLSLFMTVGSTLTYSGAVTGAVWVVQLPLLVTAVMMFQIYAARARASELTNAWLPQPIASAAEPGQIQRPAFIRLSLAILLTGFLISGSLFVVIPRGTGLDDWNMLRVNPSRSAGFTEEVDLGSGSLISDSYTSVFEVRVTGERGNLGATGSTFYLRGAILESYAAGKWGERPSRPIANYTASPNRWLALSHPDPEVPDETGEVIEQAFTVLPGSHAPIPLFALYRPFSLQIDAPSVQQIRFDRTSGWLQRDQTARRPIDYKVRSRVPAPDPSRTTRPHERVSFENAGVKRIAADILQAARIDPDPQTRPLSDDEAAARAFENYLRSPAFAYTRSSDIRPPLNVDATLWFLETRKEGHCEYFATALAALCRASGIDARVVAGYLANEFDAERGVYIVRESDAHAWTEVDTGPNGWRIFDATPGSASRQEREVTYLDRFRFLSAGVDEWWVSNVVAFSQAQQDKLLSRFGAASITDTAVNLYRKSVQRTRRFFVELHSPMFAAIVVGGISLAVGLTWALIRAFRRRARRTPRELGWAMRGPEKTVYKATLDLLASRGHAKPNWSPPLVHLRDVAARDPALAARAHAIMQLLYESRFGGNSARLSEARRLLSDLRSAN